MARLAADDRPGKLRRSHPSLEDGLIETRNIKNRALGRVADLPGARFGLNSAAMSQTKTSQLRAGMVGMGMIFDETYRPFFEQVHAAELHEPGCGVCRVPLVAVASRTGKRAEAYRAQAAGKVGSFQSFSGPDAIERLVAADVDFVCVATPDDRHFAAARSVLQAGKHLLIEKPSVLSLAELDELERLARERGVLAKVVYHKLLDPDHKKLRTLVADGELRHVNNGYCSLLEPKVISGSQFAEWITGRNPGTYVAVHYIKLIDFTFGGRLKSVSCTGQRGLVGPADGPTWDSTQLRLVYQYDDGREAAFDIHTSWVTPDNFPGYVEQEVQFRFDNGLWNGHSRKRGVECTIEGQTPFGRKINMNNHYNGTFLEPWGVRSQRGYGIEVLERFVRELAQVEFGGPPAERDERLARARLLTYNDLSADRQVVAAVEAMEAILARHAAGTPNCVVEVSGHQGGLVLRTPGSDKRETLYAGKVDQSPTGQTSM
jgi:D-galacturonate reductase